MKARDEAKHAVDREHLAADGKLDVTARALSQNWQVIKEERRAVEATLESRLAVLEERLRATDASKVENTRIQ